MFHQAALVRYEASELVRQAEDERQAWAGYGVDQAHRWGPRQREQIRGSCEGLSYHKVKPPPQRSRGFLRHCLLLRFVYDVISNAPPFEMRLI